MNDRETFGFEQYELNPRAYKVFLEFFQDELLSRLAIFSSSAHMPKGHFDTSLVRISTMVTRYDVISSR